MRAEPQPSARERILDVATELFYRHGFRAVGVDTVVARSRVAKTTLYHHFRAKDDLVVAYLERSNERFWAWWEQAIAGATQPREQLLALFEAVGRLACSPQCLGCAFQGTAAEFPDAEHPGHRVARAHKEAVLGRLRALAAASGAREPDELARALLLLMDGAFAASRMFGAHESPAAAVAGAARTLIEAGTPAGAPS